MQQRSPAFLCLGYKKSHSQPRLCVSVLFKQVSLLLVQEDPSFLPVLTPAVTLQPSLPSLTCWATVQKGAEAPPGGKAKNSQRVLAQSKVFDKHGDLMEFSITQGCWGTFISLSWSLRWKLDNRTLKTGSSVPQWRPLRADGFQSGLGQMQGHSDYRPYWSLRVQRHNTLWGNGRDCGSSSHPACEHLGHWSSAETIIFLWQSQQQFICPASWQLQQELHVLTPNMPGAHSTVLKHSQ